MKFHYPSDGGPGPLMSRLIAALREEPAAPMTDTELSAQQDRVDADIARMHAEHAASVAKLEAVRAALQAEHDRRASARGVL